MSSFSPQELKLNAEKGDTHSMYEYGLLLLEGNQVPKDEKQGANYIKMSADKGYIKAIIRYSELLIEGKGVGASLSESAKYLKLGADLEDPYCLHAIYAKKDMVFQKMKTKQTNIIRCQLKEDFPKLLHTKALDIIQEMVYLKIRLKLHLI